MLSLLITSTLAESRSFAGSGRSPSHKKGSMEHITHIQRQEAEGTRLQGQHSCKYYNIQTLLLPTNIYLTCNKKLSLTNVIHGTTVHGVWS